MYWNYAIHNSQTEDQLYSDTSTYLWSVVSG